MSWTFRISFLLLVAWAIFMVSPFIALYDLAKAVENKDVARISERVNFPALRVSISRQVIGDFIHTPEGRAKVGDLDGKLATQAGAVVVNPIVEQFINPEALIDLLDDGWPKGLPALGNALTAGPISLSFGSLGEGVKLFFASESNGFRSLSIPFPPDNPPERQFRVTLRISGGTWRVTGIDLPKKLREELTTRVRKLAT